MFKRIVIAAVATAFGAVGITSTAEAAPRDHVKVVKVIKAKPAPADPGTVTIQRAIDWE